MRCSEAPTERFDTSIARRAMKGHKAITRSERPMDGGVDVSAIHTIRRSFRPEILLSPDIIFIVFHPIFIQEFTEFILEAHFLMMLFLVIDIPDDGIKILRAYRKRSITLLPCEV